MSAPTYNASDGVDAAGSASIPMSFTHTTSGADEYLIVGFRAHGSNPSTPTATADGNAMELLAYAYDGSLAENNCIFGLIVTAGSHTIVISGADGTSFSAIALTYNGVNSVTPHGTGVGTSAFSSTPSETVASAANETVIELLSGYTTESMTPTSGQTVRYSTNAAGDLNFGETSPGSSSVTTSWSYSLNYFWNLTAVSLKPISGGGGSTFVNWEDMPRPERVVHEIVSY